MIFSRKIVKPHKKKDKYIQPKPINLCLRPNIQKDTHNVVYKSEFKRILPCNFTNESKNNDSSIENVVVFNTPKKDSVCTFQNTLQLLEHNVNKNVHTCDQLVNFKKNAITIMFLDKILKEKNHIYGDESTTLELQINFFKKNTINVTFLDKLLEEDTYTIGDVPYNFDIHPISQINLLSDIDSLKKDLPLIDRTNNVFMNVFDTNPRLELLNAINHKSISNIENKPTITLILRGHIRDSFESKDMYNFVKHISSISNLKLYIHTWCIRNGKQSWKNYDNNFHNIENTEEVTVEKITNYFRDIIITKIIIDNDQTIQLLGNKEGLICNTKCPIIAWKNMWFGIHKIFSYINQNDICDKTIECRLDLFASTNSCESNFEKAFILEKTNNYVLEKNKSTNPSFLTSTLKPGIDNIIYGDFNKIYLLVKLFHEHLDTISQKYPNITHQEYLVPIVSNNIFENNHNKLST